MTTENQAPEGGPSDDHLMNFLAPWVIADDPKDRADFLAALRAALAAQPQPDLLRMLATRARSFPRYPLGYHIPEVFAALGEEPPEPQQAPAEGARSTLRIEYDNDSGPEGYFQEWWSVIDEALGETLCQCDDEATAKRILAALSATQPKGMPAGYVTAIEEGKVLMLPRPSLDTAGLVAVYAAAQAPAPVALTDKQIEQAAIKTLMLGVWMEHRPLLEDFARAIATQVAQAPAVGADDAKDAARYRWLRKMSNTKANIDIGAGCEISDTLDEAIDAAMNSDVPVQGSEHG